MRTVPREAFVPASWREQAYDDRPLPIDAGQTISQPYIVALMCEALQLTGDERVLEIGTGSGYAAAVLSRLAAQVDTVERIAELAEGAARVLSELNVSNVRVHCADGTLGWPDAAPFDAITVTAGGPVVPPALLAAAPLTLVPVAELPALPFDHRAMVDAAVARVRSKSQYSSMPVHLCAEPFTLPQLQAVYEAVLGEPINKVSFRRKVDELAMLEAVPGALQTGGAHRPAQLYRVRPTYRRQLSLSARGL